MIPKPQRLTKNKEFDAVFVKGRASYSDFIGIKCSKNGLVTSRFGIIAGLKVSKKSTLRNTVKRRVRQILIAEMDLLLPGYDCAIICRPAIIGKNSKTIRQNLQYLFGRLKLYKKNR